jgi:excisionase family DNA binding protein
MAGIGVHDDRNRCSPSIGFGVQVRPEWAFTMGRNTQLPATLPWTTCPNCSGVEEAATYLGISKGLVYELAQRGALPSVKLVRLLRITRDGLAKLVTERKTA